MPKKVKRKSVWIGTREMATSLGIAPKTLRRRLSDMRRGRHWIDLNPNGDRRMLRWHRRNVPKFFGITETEKQ